jgi:cytoskeletal protein CcmA (bactofilin family)
MLQKPSVTVLTAETEFKGVLAFAGELHLHGRLEGTIDAESGLLVIGDSAIIKADIHAQDVLIHGKVQGNVFASGRVELRGKAQVYGDVRSNRFIIEDGVVFVGRSEILSERAEPAPDFSQIFTRINGKDPKAPRSPGA